MKKSNTMVLKFKASQTILCDQDRRRLNSNARTSWRCISYFSDLLQLARPYFVKLWKGSLLVLLAEKLVISLYQVSVHMFVMIPGFKNVVFVVVVCVFFNVTTPYFVLLFSVSLCNFVSVVVTQCFPPLLDVTRNFWNPVTVSVASV